MFLQYKKFLETRNPSITDISKTGRGGLVWHIKKGQSHYEYTKDKTWCNKVYLKCSNRDCGARLRLLTSGVKITINETGKRKSYTLDTKHESAKQVSNYTIERHEHDSTCDGKLDFFFHFLIFSRV